MESVSKKNSVDGLKKVLVKRKIKNDLKIRLRPAPDMNEFTKDLKAEVAEGLEKLLEGGVISKEDRDAIREDLANSINLAVNIPIIGEAIEKQVIKFFLRAVEMIAGRIAKKLIGGIVTKMNG